MCIITEVKHIFLFGPTVYWLRDQGKDAPEEVTDLSGVIVLIRCVANGWTCWGTVVRLKLFQSFSYIRHVNKEDRVLQINSTVPPYKPGVWRVCVLLMHLFYLLATTMSSSWVAKVLWTCVVQVLRKFRSYSVHVAPLETAGIFNVEMIPYCGPM